MKVRDRICLSALISSQRLNSEKEKEGGSILVAGTEQVAELLRRGRYRGTGLRDTRPQWVG